MVRFQRLADELGDILCPALQRAAGNEPFRSITLRFPYSVPATSRISRVRRRFPSSEQAGPLAKRAPPKRRSERAAVRSSGLALAIQPLHLSQEQLFQRDRPIFRVVCRPAMAEAPPHHEAAS